MFAQIILADEINRTPPKTQAALLEAMQEYHVTAAGRTYALDRPFFVLATQNPIELEGTYPLPEAQLDRFFFKVRLTYPDEQQLTRIITTTTGPEDAGVTAVFDAQHASERIEALKRLVRQVIVAPPLEQYAARIIRATLPGSAPSAKRTPISAVRWLTM